MALTEAERAELAKLAVANFDAKGLQLKNASVKEMERYNQLLGKVSEPAPVAIAKPRKNHKLTRLAQELKDEGAEYLGCENKNFGPDDKPNLVLREYFYRDDAKGEREAVMVQRDKVIVVGHKFADNCLERIA